jgi:small subunit ribosomal protein S10e
MIITKADRRTIYEALFKGPSPFPFLVCPTMLTLGRESDGVLVAKKDYNAPKHLELDVRNLLVIKACQSLTSKGFVSTQFSWQYYYVSLPCPLHLGIV